MTSHETALEAARKAFGNAVTAPGSITIPTFSPMDAFDAGWHAAFASTLSPDVSGLMERFQWHMKGASPGKWCQFHPDYVPEAKGTPFTHWDTSHDMSAVVDGKKVQRIASFTHADDAAFAELARNELPALLDALASLSLQLAAVEGERKREADLANHMANDRNDAEASLSAAQEENERLRKALKALSASIFAPNDKRSPELEAAIQMTIDVLSTQEADHDNG